MSVQHEKVYIKKCCYLHVRTSKDVSTSTCKNCNVLMYPLSVTDKLSVKHQKGQHGKKFISYACEKINAFINTCKRAWKASIKCMEKLSFLSCNTRCNGLLDEGG